MKRRRFIRGVAAFGCVSRGIAFGKETAGPLRVAVIGHTGRGDFGHELDTMWFNVPGVEVVAVADPVEKGLEKAKTRLGGVEGFLDFREMLAKVKPDIVSVAPRHVDQHAEMVIAAAEAGARGIYVEKPFSKTLAEADEMIAACEKSGTKLAVAHRMRTHPVLPVVKKLIADGGIGKVLEMRGRGKEDHRGGMLDLWVLGSHVFNLMNVFAGPAVACSATVLEGGKSLGAGGLVEGGEGVGLIGGDELHARYLMENGWTAYFDSIREAGEKGAGFGLEIIGSKGVVNLRVDQEPMAYLREGSPFDVSGKAADWVPISTAGVGVPEPIPDLGKRVGSHFLAGVDLVEAIRENRPPICNGKQGRDVMEMIVGAMVSQRSGGMVQLPLEDRGAAFAGWRE